MILFIMLIDMFFFVFDMIDMCFFQDDPFKMILYCMLIDMCFFQDDFCNTQNSSTRLGFDPK